MSNYDTRVAAIVARSQQLRRGLKELCNYEDERADIRAAFFQFIEDLKAIENRINPHFIGMIGQVSSGKSSFLNKLLGKNILASSCGSTTAAPTEIRFKDHDNIKVTIYFTGVEEFSKEIDQMVQLFSSNQEDFTRKALIMKLSKFFYFPSTGPDPINGSPLNPREGEPLSLIGRKPHSFESASEADIIREIEKYVTVDNNSATLAVKKICIEGRFSHLPYGVVLSDMPGLGDAKLMNSLRTVDAIPSFKEAWFLTSVNDSLSSETDRTYLRQVLVQLDTDLHINCTKADTLQDDIIDFEVRRVHLVRCQDTIRRVLTAAIRHVPNEHFAIADIELSLEEQAAITEKLASISIGFTGITPARLGGALSGFETWSDRLSAIGVKQQNNLTACEQSLLDIENSLASFGYEVPVTVDDALFDQWLDSFRISLNNARGALDGVYNNDGELNRLFEYAAQAGKWYDLRWNTIQATMDRNRLGFFKGVGKVRRSININEDIASQLMSRTWATQVNFRDQSLIALQTLRQLIADWLDAPDAAKQLVEREVVALEGLLNTVLHNCGGAAMKRSVRDHFRREHYYRNYRYSTPSVYEFNDVAQNRLHLEVAAGIRTIEDAATQCRDRFVALGNPVLNVPVHIRTALDSLLGQKAAAEFDIYDLHCPISGDFFSDPVATSCQHVFDRAQIRTWFDRGHNNCPTCNRLVSTEVFPRRDILVAIDLYNERQPREPEPEWWVSVWEAACETLRQTRELPAVPPPENAQADL